MAEIKEKIITAIRNLPDNITYEDVFEVLFVQEKIAKALDDSENLRFITQEEFDKKYQARIANNKAK